MIGTAEDRAFMGVARSIATLARCTHRNVGAAVVFEGRVIGHGYNKGPETRATCLEGGCPRGTLPPGQGASDYGDCIAVHAEVAAMIMAGEAFTKGSDLYVSSEPCFMCYRIAEGSGIIRVVWQADGESRMHERHLLKY